MKKILITKLAECTVRLMRIQQVENAMFDHASSEAGHPEQTIKSLDNSSERITQVVYDTITADWQYNPVALNNKIDLINEIDHQNLSDVSGGTHIEDNMPLTADYIFEKCVKENLGMYEFIAGETNQSNTNIVQMIVADGSSKEEPLPTQNILKDT